ncbi:hypothetical protein F52700_6330 [Fusarium sp. NRRL 52700]|nr:hypothetical protein F52700_6330 [Fusarium sp. NRRL 52700]
MENSNARRRANTEQNPPPSVARDHAQYIRGGQDVIGGDGDNTRSQSLGTGSNEQTNFDRRKIGAAPNASPYRTFEVDGYEYFPTANSSSDGEESRCCNQRVRDEEPEGSEEGGDDLLPSTADDQNQASKSTSPIAQSTSQEIEPLTHTGVEEAIGHGLQGDESRPLTVTPLGSFSTATSESDSDEDDTRQQ